ncbi:unnamed protein product [Paramecium primaurelia]|uniref:Uncharacterized protein n=1 Tax=Paramecium primaurelia TaxID=5886 RepID=A0A8S1L540_PARPR|nr:unnamed protein product [Paramecium primaurelia]
MYQIKYIFYKIKNRVLFFHQLILFQISLSKQLIINYYYIYIYNYIKSIQLNKWLKSIEVKPIPSDKRSNQADFQNNIIYKQNKIYIN